MVLIFFWVLVVEDSYDGPRLVNGKVTAEFAEQLLVHFKNQKKLHKKYAYQIIFQVKFCQSSLHIAYYLCI